MGFGQAVEPFPERGYGRVDIVAVNISTVQPRRHPRHATIVGLAGQSGVNARIVSVFGEFDPHIPEGSELPGARNVRLDTGGHFRILADSRILDEIEALV